MKKSKITLARLLAGLGPLSLLSLVGCPLTTVVTTSAPETSTVQSASTSGNTSDSGGTSAGSTSGGNGTGGTPNPTLPGLNPPSSTSGTLSGFFSFSQQTGLITGSATVSGEPTAVVSVALYLDNPIGAGTLLATVTSNQVIVAEGEANGFTYQPVAAYLNSVPHKLYAYMFAPGSQTGTLIGTGPTDYFAGPDSKGLAYFNANLSSTLSTTCVKCHGTSWSSYYMTRAYLGDPTPLSGGTATNNTFYTYVSGGLNHPGGNQCSGNSICQDLVTWWGMDFGK